MPAPTFDSVARQTQTTGPAGANRENAKAFWFWSKLGPKEGAAAMGKAGDQVGFLRMAQRGATYFAQTFNRSTNV